jgi:hypothetical protein
MILDHRGEPVVFARVGLGFIPTRPVAPTAEEGPATVLSSAIGFEITPPDEDETEE